MENNYKISYSHPYFYNLRIKMTNILKLEYDIPISVNHYIKHRAFMIGRYPQVSVYVTKKAKDYKDSFVKYVKEQIKLQNFEIKLNKFQFTNVDAIWYFPRIDMDNSNYKERKSDK